MPIRGHSGVQGGAEMGCYSTAFPGGVPVGPESAAELSAKWGFDVPPSGRSTAPEMIEAAARGELDFLFSAGGNFLEVLPDPDWVRRAFGPHPVARSHGHRPVAADVRRAGRGGPPAAGDDPLRDPRRDHGDVDRAPDHLQPRDPRPAHRRGAARSSTCSASSPPGYGRTSPNASASPGRPRCVPRSATMVELYAGIEELAEEGDSFQYGGTDALRGLGVSDP